MRKVFWIAVIIALMVFTFIVTKAIDAYKKLMGDRIISPAIL